MAAAPGIYIEPLVAFGRTLGRLPLIDGCYRQVTTDAGNSVLLRPNLHRESVDRPVIFVGESEFKIVAIRTEFAFVGKKTFPEAVPDVLVAVRNHSIPMLVD